MTGLALAGATPNSSFGDPSYIEFVAALLVLRRASPEASPKLVSPGLFQALFPRFSTEKTPVGTVSIGRGRKARLFSRGDATLRLSKIHGNKKKPGLHRAFKCDRIRCRMRHLQNRLRC
ncbi:hypothetical protein [Paraburkholderia sacchari]|uniref:Uncharacterized protein n=1 Tax=Paraburkholderia sacchari TaxID=159450 RepID=A0A8T6Z6S6_9BURK|nr:hypothetical protein [Paraburkholderia sacchari]NLP59980.1 hypothetical protein [Paraburkholderia sacchari]